MRRWFKGKQTQSSSNAPSVSTNPATSTNMGDCDQPFTEQGSFNLNTGNNTNKEGTQTSGGIKVVTSGKSDSVLHSKKVEFNTGNNSNEGENQVNSGIELYEVDDSKRT